MPLTRYHHLIWDWNGTLLDDLDLCIDVMNAILDRRQLPQLHRARYHALFDFPVRTYYERLGFDPAEDSFARLSVEFISGYDARRLESSLHPAARRVLAAASAAGLRQSILSAYRQETLHEIVQHFGLAAHFDHIAGLPNIHAHSKLALGHALVRRLAEDMSQAPPEVASPSVQALNDWDGVRAMADVRVPIIAINSDLGPPTEEERIRGFAPTFRAVVVPGTGHFLMMEDPARLNPIIDAQIRGLP